MQAHYTIHKKIGMDKTFKKRMEFFQKVLALFSKCIILNTSKQKEAEKMTTQKDKIIEALEATGATHWAKGSVERMYFDFNRYSVAKAFSDLSHTAKKTLSCSNVYFDLVTEKLVIDLPIVGKAKSQEATDAVTPRLQKIIDDAYATYCAD